MKNTPLKLTFFHLLISLLFIIIWIQVLFIILNEPVTISSLALIYVLICTGVAIPIFIGVYFGYKFILKKIKFAKVITPLLILIGAIILPLILYWENVINKEPGYSDWGGLFVLVLTFSNLVLFLVNEIVYFINLKKLKS